MGEEGEDLGGVDVVGEAVGLDDSCTNNTGIRSVFGTEMVGGRGVRRGGPYRLV